MRISTIYNTGFSDPPSVYMLVGRSAHAQLGINPDGLTTSRIISPETHNKVIQYFKEKQIEIGRAIVYEDSDKLLSMSDVHQAISEKDIQIEGPYKINNDGSVLLGLDNIEYIFRGNNLDVHEIYEHGRGALIPKYTKQKIRNILFPRDFLNLPLMLDSGKYAIIIDPKDIVPGVRHMRGGIFLDPHISNGLTTDLQLEIYHDGSHSYRLNELSVKLWFVDTQKPPITV